MPCFCFLKAFLFFAVLLLFCRFYDFSSLLVFFSPAIPCPCCRGLLASTVHRLAFSACLAPLPSPFVCCSCSPASLRSVAGGFAHCLGIMLQVTPWLVSRPFRSKSFMALGFLLSIAHSFLVLLAAVSSQLTLFRCVFLTCLGPYASFVRAVLCMLLTRLRGRAFFGLPHPLTRRKVLIGPPVTMSVIQPAPPESLPSYNSIRIYGLTSANAYYSFVLTHPPTNATMRKVHHTVTYMHHFLDSWCYPPHPYFLIQPDNLFYLSPDSVVSQ